LWLASDLRKTLAELAADLGVFVSKAFHLRRSALGQLRACMKNKGYDL
jgi:hypothetical protein